MCSWSRTTTFKIGFGIVYPHSNITIKNSISYRSSRAIGIDYIYGDTTASNITFDSIDVEGYWPRTFNSSQWLDMKLSTEGKFQHVVIKNINIRNLGTSRSQILGYNTTGYIDSVLLQNICVPGKTTPATSLAEMNVTDVNSYIKIGVCAAVIKNQY